MLKLAESLGSRFHSLEDSAAFQDVLQALRHARSVGTAGSVGQDAGTGLTRLQEFLSRAVSSKTLANMRWPDLSGLPVPALPAMRWPDLGRIVPPRVPNGDAGEPPGRDSGGTLFLGAAAIGLVAVLIWSMNRRAELAAQATPGAGGRAHWQVGPWPVAPDSLASREDIIRAFEYLCVLKLGPEARAWNHRQAAKRLGTDDRASTALHLAGLYERARYAPEAEGFSERAIMDARGDLSRMAEDASA
jgi:hypothetical protein